MFQLKAKILYNKVVLPGYGHCALSVPEMAKAASPGQFVNLRITDAPEPLLRRPFGIHRVNASGIEILYQVLGKGTQILLRKKKGESLDIIGPLGKGFDFAPYAIRHTPCVLVAGGMGVAPLVYLAEKIEKQRMRSARGKTQVLIGAKTKKEILCANEFEKLGCEVKIATDDGSKGFKGYVSDLLLRLLTTNDQHPTTIYACGPRGMLKAVGVLAKKYKIPAQISLEEHLACGIGACLGCAVKTLSGYQRVCKEGPVFKAEEIIW